MKEKSTSAHVITASNLTYSFELMWDVSDSAGSIMG